MRKRHDLKPFWAVLGLIVTAGAVVASDNQTGPSQESQDILLVATLLNSSEGRMPGAADYWMVKVNEVLMGPEPCAEEIRVVTYQATPPPWGTADSDLLEGDKVWINGRYQTEEQGCEITLQGSDEYYLRKYPAEIKFLGTAVAFSDVTMPGNGPRWTVRVDQVLQGPEPCSDQLEVITSAALFPAVWGSVEPGIKAEDSLEVFAAYHTNPNSGTCSATLYGSKGYYIKKVGPE